MIKNTTKTVLIAERDADLRRSVRQQLELQEGLTGRETENAEQTLATLREQHVDIILIAMSLTDINGRDLCRILRRQGFKAPIIVLSDADNDAETILALDSGASDVVIKPWTLGVLMARVRAHLRQFDQVDDAIFPIGPYTFRPSTKILENKTTKKKIHLTEREAAILKCLYRIGDRPAKRQVLLGEVWGYQANVSTHTLESHIYRLRKKVEPDPTRVQILITDPEGYRLVR